MADLYEQLGVDKDADADAIKAAHRRAVRRTHPDAGGDRDAFDRVQRAFNVLSDQSRRARYDETGVGGDIDPEALARAQAMTTVAGKINALISNPDLDPRTVDLVLAVRELIAAEMAGMHEAIQESRRLVIRFQTFERRLKRKKDKKGADIIKPMIAAQAAAHQSRIAQLQDGLKVMTMAQDLVAEYVYEVDKTVQLTMNSATRGGWVFGPGV